MQSATEENSCDGASGVPTGSVVQVCFPNVQASVLDSLNRQREDGQLCDLSIHVQGHVFKAHRCVLAASSPYFHDQVLLKNMSTVSIPAVMDPLAFERVLSCAYTGQLQMLREDIVNYLTIGSVLQMWHIVDKCTELLREDRGGSSGPQGTAPSSESTRCNSIANRDSYGGEGHTQSIVQPLNRPSLIESQSPSSTNYFSPKDASFGGAMASSGTVGDGGIHSTPNYCMSSSREDAFLIDEEEEEDDELVYPRKQDQGSGRRKKPAPASDQEMGVSDSFGVSSYQDIESSPPQKRPMYSQPSIMPRKQWVVVKTERSRDDDLIMVSGEEGGENEDEQDLEKERERERTFNISNVRTLSADLSSREEIEAQVDYCQSPEDYLKFESGLMDQTSSQHTLENPSQSSSRAVSALLSSVQTAAARTQLFPLDMQGNQIVLYNQPSPTVGLQESLPGVSLKGTSEHGTVQLTGQGGMDSGLDGLDGNGAGATGKVFMCHCGKRFTHKSMRDRHINMHLDLRPFHCPVCSKKFKMKHHLTEHMKTHTGLKPYDCLSCGKKFMWRDSFMRHRSHCDRHGGISGTSEAQGSEGSVVSPQNPLQHQPSGNKGTQGSAGGRSGIPVLSPHHSSSSSSSSSSRSGLSMAVPGSLLGINPQSGMYGHGSGVLGLEVSQSECGEDISEVCIGENSVT
ncbi:zinc finger and BTB domain-containing protein 22b [Neoarius graeffei]|uniref:zinc finger and BTB domain-containing protein 22b n=1 Tax=Neoarius graeffei TaxID=443677 RepID=UPI00298D2641|nr:zinc finger and BTB domain-containing protein 22b [Neoarius graeffei]XP_060760969.1 zinc finger and BTB domain-containing protein 22b [Neoarius graeffei]